MLVSAAMADRPRATAPAGSRPAPAPGPVPAARHSTARVATTAGVRKSELPGWFWGALGCMTVLVVGLAIVFIVGQSSGRAPGSSAPAGATATASVTAPVGTPADQRTRGPGIQIEPMAPAAAAPAARPTVTPPAAHARPARPIKVARSPSGSPRPTVAAKPEAGGAAPAASDGDGDEEELLKPRPRATATADDEKSDDGN